MKKNQKWLILFAVLVLMAGTAGALTWLKTHQKLGRPGIITAPIPGSATMKIDLPAQVLDFTSTNVPESEIELGYFPKDTSFVERYYLSPGGSPAISATIVLMGADRTSIHRPEYCLAGQGYSCDEKTVVDIPVGGPKPYPLPVAKWKVSRMIQQPDGQNVKISGIYVFWFVADNEQTTGNVQFQCYLVRDLPAGAGRSRFRAHEGADCGLGAGVSTAASICRRRPARMKRPLRRSKKSASVVVHSN